MGGELARCDAHNRIRDDDVEDDDPAPRGGEVGGQPERAGGGRGEVVRDEDGAEANGGQAGQAPLTSRLRRLGGLPWRSSR